MDRRSFLSQGLSLTGAVVLGCRSREDGEDAVRIEVCGFEDEGAAPMHFLVGEGKEGRRFTDLSALNPGDVAVSRDRFFVRTRAPAGLSTLDPWVLRVYGLGDQPLLIPLADLSPSAKPQGVICMECAGNDPGGRFGLLSSARWDGISWKDILSRIRRETSIPDSAAHVLFRGADGGDDGGYGESAADQSASWIFRLQDLESAFLATGLDGAPLSPDHGSPARLLVPGWYGCACIKWVKEITFLGEDATASLHMRDYAGRTHQAGIPDLAKDFRPARMGLSALPVRIEKSRDAGGIQWRLLGLTWGGDAAGEDVQIQTGDMAWKDVDVLARRETAFGWTWWSYSWRPPQPGIYTVTLRPKDPVTRSIRLRDGYYARDCRIDQT